jgi:hypothetical protein
MVSFFCILASLKPISIHCKTGKSNNNNNNKNEKKKKRTKEKKKENKTEFQQREENKTMSIHVQGILFFSLSFFFSFRSFNDDV